MIVKAQGAGAALRRLVIRLFSRDSRDDMLHVLTTLALAPLYAVPPLLFVTGVALTPLFLVGLPLLPLAMSLAETAARAERGRLRLMRGTEVDMPRPGMGSTWRDRVERLFGRRSWRRLGFTAVLALWGLGAGAPVVTLLALGSLLLLLPLIGPLLPEGAVLLGLDPSAAGGALLGCAAGAGLLAAAWWLPRPLSRVEEALTVRMLGSGEVDYLVRRVIDLEDSRSRMVDAAEQERRRIERDLHDGAQQRLLSVAMSLGRAKSRFDRDPEKARTLLATAHEEAKAAMEELRDVARGLHPAVLTEQGLGPALTAVAARCPVPVDLRVTLSERPSPRAESVAYYVVSEALTNVAKHAAATEATVTVLREDHLLRVAVADNGIGSADPDRGTGLNGLRDRVRAVDGHLVCTSPFGGPTVIDATIPWRA